MIDLADFAMSESAYPDAEAELAATKDEILSLIKIILQRLDGMTLVFDGVDEISDTDDFSNYLVQATSCASGGHDSLTLQSGLEAPTSIFQYPRPMRTKIALFCRPDLSIPKSLLQRAFCIQLNSEHNLVDITAFMYSCIQGLVDEELLEDHVNPSRIVSSISSRADGMFLWAKLLIDYLRCETFTPEDRMEALDNLISLEGLDRLYHAILQNLQERLPAKGRATVRRAFAWVAGALRPLHIDEFKLAIAIAPDEKRSTVRTIPNIEQALTKMSGSLLELASNGVVHFIHPSVRDYLYGQSPDCDVLPRFDFGLQITQTQLQLSDLCLIFILQHGPIGPLSGSADITPDRTVVTNQYPFFDYSIEFWEEHCTAGLRSLSASQTAVDAGTLRPLIQRINEFILKKDLVTTWIEASWLFGCPLNLGNLVSYLGQLLLCKLQDLDQKRVEKLTANLWLLASDIEQLRINWDSTLKMTPNEIWNPSISGFTSSDFWVKVPGSTWKYLKDAAQEQDKAIIVESQTSDDSLELALIKIVVPR